MAPQAQGDRDDNVELFSPKDHPQGGSTMKTPISMERKKSTPSEASWFKCGDNYSNAKRSATELMMHLSSNLKPGEKWINDGSKDFGFVNPRHKDFDFQIMHKGQEMPPSVFAFPPEDKVYFCNGREDPNSQVDIAYVPRYKLENAIQTASNNGDMSSGSDSYTDGQSSTWRRLTEIVPVPRLFPPPRPTVTSAQASLHGSVGAKLRHEDNSAEYTNMPKDPVFHTDSIRQGTHFMGRVYQAGIHNKYLVDALQMLALRPRLLRSIFIQSDIGRGIFSVMLYKTGEWRDVTIDDFVPCTEAGDPLVSLSDRYVSQGVIWPSLLEKAYAKLHVCGGNGKIIGGWEVLGEGGDPAAALSDFTGGVGSAFSCKDVSSDRLFIYLHQLQAEALFICSIDKHMCEIRGVRLTRHFSYCINRVCDYEGQCYVQLHCSAPVFEDGGLGEAVPYSLTHNEEYPEQQIDGFFWLNIEDFSNYFDTIYEVRLVNSGNLGRIPNMPEAKRYRELDAPPSGQVCIKFFQESVFAFPGTVDVTTTPDFLIEVQEAPCEVAVCLCQTDERLVQTEPGRPTQAAFLLKVYERMLDMDDGKTKHISFVAKSHWGQNRDTVAWFRAVKKSQYLVNASLPRLDKDGKQIEVKKLVLRVYSTQRVKVECRTKKEMFKLVNAPLHAVKWSMVGAYHNPAEKLDWKEHNPNEGKGYPFAFLAMPKDP